MWEDSQYVDILALTRGVDMSDASSSSRNKRSLLPVGRVHTEDVSARVQAGGESESVDFPADQEKPKKKMRKSKLLRSMAHNSAKPLECFLERPFANPMDLTEIFKFWQDLKFTEICRALSGHFCRFCLKSFMNGDLRRCMQESIQEWA